MDPSLVGALERLVEKVVPGRGIGKKLGFPTLNMERPTQVIPAESVYAGFVRIGQIIEDIIICDEKFPAVYSIGQAKTYSKEFPLLIEAHLLIENIGQLYDKWLAMDFIERIRDQQKFKTEARLSAQIAKDCGKAKEILRRK